MTTTPGLRPSDLAIARATSLAERMLSGGAVAGIVAWRLDAEYDMVAHGLLPTGDLVVALRPRPGCLLRSLSAGVPVDVRVDLFRHAQVITLDVVAASLHLLGELTFLREDDATRDRGWLPERVADLAALDGTRLGVIEANRLLVHDNRGVTPLNWNDAVRPQPDFPRDDLATFDAVWSWGEAALELLCDSVRAGLIPGEVSARAHKNRPCPHVVDRVFLVDVDRTGITLMQVTAEEQVTIFLAFSEAPETLTELEASVAALMEDSGAVRPKRI